MEPRNQSNSRNRSSSRSAQPTNLKQERTSSPHNEPDGKTTQKDLVVMSQDSIQKYEQDASEERVKERQRLD